MAWILEHCFSQTYDDNNDDTDRNDDDDNNDDTDRDDDTDRNDDDDDNNDDTDRDDDNNNDDTDRDDDTDRNDDDDDNDDSKRKNNKKVDCSCSITTRSNNCSPSHSLPLTISLDHQSLMSLEDAVECYLAYKWYMTYHM